MERFGVCVAPGRTEFQDVKCIGRKKVCVCVAKAKKSYRLLSFSYACPNPLGPE